MFTNILLPTDGSEVANRAVDAGIALARQLGAKVTLVTVRRPEWPDHGEEGVLNTAAAKADAAGVPVAKVLRSGNDTAAEILAAATDAGADLIAMASHGRQGLSAVLLGSQTDQVTKHSTIPVLIYRF